RRRPAVERPCRGPGHPGRLTCRQPPSDRNSPADGGLGEGIPAMPVTVVRLNLVAPGASPSELGARYRAALEMAACADDRGVTTVQTEEHHGSGDNWLPAPFTVAGAVLDATRRITVTAAAMIGPLYHPLRLAEEIAVPDLLSGGRL